MRTSAPAVLLGLAIPVALAGNNGGYWPTAWGWTSLVLAWIAGVGLFFTDRRFGRIETTALIAFTVFIVWIACSISWSSSGGEAVLEVERGLVYPLGLLAALVIVRKASVVAFVAGLAAAVVTITTYSLATRLFPESIGVFDPVARYRLAEPLGYWNALGIFAVMGTLLSLGFAARARSILARAVAAAVLPILVTTLYFTFSRGAWIALGVGLVAAIAIDPRRLQLVSLAAVLSPLPFAAVWLASRSDALTHQSSTLAAATREGHRLALWIVLLCAGSAALALAFTLVERRFRPRRHTRRAYAAALATAALAVVGGVLVHYGGSVSLTERVYDAFRAAPTGTGSSGNLNNRLFDLSGNGRFDMWRVAVKDYRSHRLLGSGAGSYQEAWYQNRPIAGTVRDAHSLYFEALAELGPIGLALLLVALITPLVAVAKARGEPMTVAAAGAYVAFLAHAGVDWDWEVTAVTLLALFCAAAILVSARDGPSERAAVTKGTRFVPLAALLALSAAFAFVGLLGNSKIAAARTAAEDGRWQSVESKARSASRWAPWSSEPWELLATAQLAQGQVSRSRASFRKALSRAPEDWTLWFKLAQTSNGAARRQALAKARRLNPLSPEIAQYVAANPNLKVRP